MQFEDGLEMTDNLINVKPRETHVGVDRAVQSSVVLVTGFLCMGPSTAVVVGEEFATVIHKMSLV